MTRRLLIGIMMLMLIPATIFGAGTQEQEGDIVIWHPFPEETHFIQYAARVWNEENPDSFKVETRFIPFADLKREIAQSLVTGEVPDIYMVDNPDHASFAAAGAFFDITEWVKDWGQADEYFPGPWNSTIWEGKNYGLPVDSNTILLYYNKDAFKQAGIAAPPTTWKELLSAAEKLTSLGPNFKGIAFSAIRSEEGTFQFLPFMQQAGGTVEDINGEGGVAALSLWTELVQKGYASPEVINITQNEAVGLLASGNVGMAISGPWSLGLMKQADFNWGLALLPLKEDVGIQSSAMGGYNMAIMADSESPNNAWTFMKWLQTPENIRRFYWDYLKGARIPSRADVANDTDKWVKDPQLKVFIEQLAFAKPRGPHPEWPSISNAIQIAIQKSLTGQATPQAALDEAATTLDKFFK
jgi:multiple sugar transport system substrate-binding protein